jgi:AraC-like DNA-binding protein
MTAFAEGGRLRPRTIERGVSNVRTRFPTNAANYRRHCRIDGSFRLRAARIDGSHVVGTFASDGSARTNERHLRPRRGRRLGTPQLRGGWSVRRLGRSWLVLVASRRRSSGWCGDPLRRSQKCASICGPTAGACHVLVLHRAVPHPGLLGLLPVIANAVHAGTRFWRAVAHAGASRAAFERQATESQHSAMLQLDAKSDRVQIALAFAKQNLREPLTVELLADAARLSPRQFSRVFRAETGLSPAKAIENLRLEAARFMLEQGRLPIEEIARETGFGDRERMRRSFLRTFSATPQALRNAAHPLATI